MASNDYYGANQPSYSGGPGQGREQNSIPYPSGGGPEGYSSYPNQERSGGYEQQGGHSQYPQGGGVPYPSGGGDNYHQSSYPQNQQPGGDENYSGDRGFFSGKHSQPPPQQGQQYPQQHYGGHSSGQQNDYYGNGPSGHNNQYGGQQNHVGAPYPGGGSAQQGQYPSGEYTHGEQQGYPGDPNQTGGAPGPDGERGLLASLGGGAAGAFAGRKFMGGGLLGTVAGAAFGALGANIAENKIKKHKKNKKEKKYHEGSQHGHQKRGVDSSSSSSDSD